MNELINVLSQDGNLVVSSREVASNFEKEHNDTKKRIRELEKDMGEISHNYFIKEEYKDTMNRTQEEYLLTRDGFSLLVMGFTGQKALQWKLKYIEAFNKMEVAIKSKLSPQEIMRIQLNMIDDHEGRINKLENTMTIDYGQQRVIRAKVNARVTHWLDGKKSNAYKEISKKVFSECNRDIQDYFNVNSRNNIPKMKFDTAIDYIVNWEPSTNTKMTIRYCNSQMAFSK